MNSLSWSKKAQGQLGKIQPSDRSKIIRAAGELTNFPECRNVKRLTNHKYDYRLRVGRYRVMFDFDGEVRIISIEEVLKRDENTY
ncbi:MAG: type II toxin-antitoxin system RelE family toxin [Aeromonas veronii]